MLVVTGRTTSPNTCVGCIFVGVDGRATDIDRGGGFCVGTGRDGEDAALGRVGAEVCVAEGIEEELFGSREALGEEVICFAAAPGREVRCATAPGGGGGARLRGFETSETKAGDDGVGEAATGATVELTVGGRLAEDCVPSIAADVGRSCPGLGFVIGGATFAVELGPPASIATVAETFP